MSVTTDPLFVIGNGASKFSLSDALTVLKDGKVGIGTATPQATLHVKFVMKLEPTNSPGTCSSTLEGSIYYDLSMKKPCYCDGTSWKLFDGLLAAYNFSLKISLLVLFNILVV